MSEYRRLRVPGGTYFFTVKLAQPAVLSLIDHIDTLRGAYAEVHRTQPFTTRAIVVLPDHLHAVWTLPDGDSDCSRRWQRIKTLFTKRTGPRVPRGSSHAQKGECGLWQAGFWEHKVRDATDLRDHMWHCWLDPVRHGAARSPRDWPHSSIHRDAALFRACANRPVNMLARAGE